VVVRKPVNGSLSSRTVGMRDKDATKCILLRNDPPFSTVVSHDSPWSNETHVHFHRDHTSTLFSIG
jgi:hypothetical protein